MLHTIKHKCYVVHLDIKQYHILTSVSHTGWRRCIGCLKLQVSFRKRATNYGALLQKMTHKDKASYGSVPPCSIFSSELAFENFYHTLFAKFQNQKFSKDSSTVILHGTRSSELTFQNFYDTLASKFQNQKFSKDSSTVILYGTLRSGLTFENFYHTLAAKLISKPEILKGQLYIYFIRYIEQQADFREFLPRPSRQGKKMPKKFTRQLATKLTCVIYYVKRLQS